MPPHRYTRLLTGTIIGCIDGYGAIHCQFQPFELGRYPILHSDLWPGVHHKRWRWTHDTGIRLSCIGDSLEGDEADAVRALLTKRFGLLWWENGFHDITDLLAKARAEGWTG